MVNRSKTTIGISVVAAAVAWLVLGGLLGFAGFAFTSFIPFIGLGLFLAALGALLHSVFVVLCMAPAWWKVGMGLSVVLSSFSIVSGTLTGDRFPIAFMLFFVGYYFIFGSLFYFLIQRSIVEYFGIES